jgi:hypothetical protein
MSRPLVINGATTPKSLIEIADNKIFTHAWRILDEFQSSDTNTGSVGLTGGTIPSGTTAIGTFVDTRRQSGPGAHPVGTETYSTTSTFFQYNGTETEDYVRPLKWDSTLNGIRESSNSDLDSHLIAQALSFLTSTADNYGLGQYRLQPSSPTGGTWENMGSITDRITNSDGTVTENITKLWKKTSQSGTFNTSVRRPLKIDTSTTPDSIKEMTDDEIKGLVKRFSNRIIESGIGTYVVQEDAPASGTWIRSGDAFHDDRRTVADATYTGSYTGYYAGSRTYSGTYTGNYSGTYTGNYTGTAYAGSYLGPGTAFYGGFARAVNMYYVGYYAAVYTGNYTGTYTGNYDGSRTYSNSGYAGAYSGDYTGATVQTGTESISNVSLWMRTS